MCIHVYMCSSQQYAVQELVVYFYGLPLLPELDTYQKELDSKYAYSSTGTGVVTMVYSCFFSAKVCGRRIEVEFINSKCSQKQTHQSCPLLQLYYSFRFMYTHYITCIYLVGGIFQISFNRYRDSFALELEYFLFTFSAKIVLFQILGLQFLCCSYRGSILWQNYN